MSEKQYYVKLTFEWGTDTDGELAPKTTGEVLWASMSYADSVGLQTYAIIPSLNDAGTKAGELGLMKSGSIPVPDIKPKGKPA